MRVTPDADRAQGEDPDRSVIAWLSRGNRNGDDVIGKIAIPGHVFFADGLPKTPSGKIMRRLLKEILEKGEVQSDTTALEDRSSIEKLKATVQAAVRV